MAGPEPTAPELEGTELSDLTQPQTDGSELGGDIAERLTADVTPQARPGQRVLHGAGTEANDAADAEPVEGSERREASADAEQQGESSDLRRGAPKPARPAQAQAIRSVVDALMAESIEALDDALVDELSSPNEVEEAAVSDLVDEPLPPARAAGGPARITLGQDLTLEVDVHDGVVEVTLEGDPEAVEPLSDLGRDLDDELRRHGWSLGTFAERRQQGQARSTLYRSRRALRAAQDGAEADEPRTRRIRRGHVVDVLA